MPVGLLFVFFGKTFFRSSEQFLFGLFFFFFFLLSSYMSYLNILYINPLLVTSFANIFFHLVGHPFILLVSFAVQKLLSLIVHAC